MEKKLLRCGDIVKVKDTSEELVVAYEENGLVFWLGYPYGYLQRESVDIVELVDDKHHDLLVNECLENWSPNQATGHDNRKYKLAYYYRPSLLVPLAKVLVQQARNQLQQCEENLKDIENRCKPGLSDEKG